MKFMAEKFRNDFRIIKILEEALRTIHIFLRIIHELLWFIEFS